MITWLLEVRNQIHLNWTPRIDAQPIVKAIDHNIKCVLGSRKKCMRLTEIYLLTIIMDTPTSICASGPNLLQNWTYQKLNFIMSSGFQYFSLITWRIHPYRVCLRRGYSLLSKTKFFVSYSKFRKFVEHIISINMVLVMRNRTLSQPFEHVTNFTSQILFQMPASWPLVIFQIWWVCDSLEFAHGRERGRKRMGCWSQMLGHGKNVMEHLSILYL